MNKLDCCSQPELSETLVDLGHAESMEYMLGQCKNCKKYWLNVFCVPTAVSGYQSATDVDALKMLSLKGSRELKKFMKEWGYNYL